MPSPTTPDDARRERLAAKLANLTPEQRQQLRQRVAQQRQEAPESSAEDSSYGDSAVAIIGMGCRLPGAANPEEFWKLIENGEEAVGPVPSDRWDQSQFFDPTGRSPGKMSVNAIGAIGEVDQFDPAFFGISPREAARMDPQQRLLLEVAWETLEQAGIPPTSMRGSNTGVFIGIGGTDYSKVPARYPDYFQQVDAHMGTGNALSIAAGRISYLFDLQGPSFIVDTACSSGLVAIHSAAVSLLRNECDAAMVGAVNLILSPETTIAFSKARMLSPDGHCRPFDAGANGYVRGEGCVLVMLKRMADALRDGDQILGVLRGSAVNQDGRTSGITAPSGEAQQRVIHSAMKAASVTENQITYVEAHGTGTPLGDPIELMALDQTFAKRDRSLPPIAVGSVKANIGHTETVSGVAGLLKVLLMFGQQKIPAQVNFSQLNPNVSLKSDVLQVAERSQDWHANADNRWIAGVSSFGFGGTNAHLIVEKPRAAKAADADSTTPASRPVCCPPVYCLPYSARSESALNGVASLLADTLQDVDTNTAHNLCATTALHRDSHPIRGVALGATPSQLRDCVIAPRITGKRPTGRRTKTAMMFTGQGSQYARMGQRLVETLPVFAEAIDHCCEVLDPVLPIPLREVLLGNATSAGRTVDHTSLAQPAICAIQCALVDAYRSVGVVADVVTGHSIGEIAALYAAKALTLQQALLIAAHRGQVMGDLPEGGAMTALLTDSEAAQRLIQSTNSTAVIATMNGSSSTVVAGTSEAVKKVAEAAEHNEIAVRSLTVSHAFHSPLMQDAVEPFREKLSDLMETVKVPRNVMFISGLTGLRQTEIDIDYWIRHLVQPVRFTDVINQLDSQRPDVAIEIGPRPQLCGMIKRTLSANQQDPIRTVPSLDSKQDDFQGWNESIAAAWCVGAAVDWRQVFKPFPFTRIDLPTYPFQRERFWYDPPSIGCGAAGASVAHPLLGTKQSLANGDTVYSNVFRDNDPSYFGDHVVSGSVTVPAAAWIEILRAAGQRVFADHPIQLTDVQISRALFLTSGQPVAIQTHARAAVGGRTQIEVAYQTGSPEDPDAQWQPCASARVTRASVTKGQLEISPKIPPVESTAQSPKQSADELYEAMAASGLEYGEFFRPLGEISRDDDRASASLHLSDQLTCPPNQLHPALLDGALQLIATVLPNTSKNKTFLPVAVDSVTVANEFAPISSVNVQRISPTANQHDFDQIVANVELLDAEGRLIAQLIGVQLKSLSRDSKNTSSDPNHWLYAVDWHALQLSGETTIGNVSHVGGKRTEGLPLIDAAFQETPDAPAHWIWSAPESSASTSQNVSQATLSLLNTIQSAIKESPAPVVSVLTERAFRTDESTEVDPVSTAVAGLARVASNEHPQLSIKLLDVGALDKSTAPLIHQWLSSDRSESETALRGGKFFRPRLQPAPKLLRSNDTEAELGLPESGTYRVRLDGTNRTEGLWIQRIPSPPTGPGEVALNINAVGLNFSDVLKSMGLYPGIKDNVVPLGIEVCGRLTKLGEGADAPPIGTRVMGVVPHGFASDDATNDYLVTEVPSHLSDEEAAALPIAFLTAQHALLHVGRLQKGESVLIHAGAGGVGLAAIQIAQTIGATIFTTAGHPVKRRLLAQLGVDEANIFNSRDVRSIEAIRERTGDAGVDVVLNSLPGDWIDASLGQLAAHGRFLEIGKIDIYQNRGLGLLPFQDNLSYAAIDLDRLLRERPEHVRKLYAEITAALNDGTYTPLPITSFRLEELSQSMRFMAARRNIGKIVVSPPQSKPDIATGDGVHLITGGSGAIARGVAKRLVQRGAKTVALIARSPIKQSTTDLIDWAGQHGANVLYVQADCNELAGLQPTIQAFAQSHGPVIGVTHTAGMLKDGLIHDLSAEDLNDVLQPKVAGTIAISEATMDQPLQYFTMLGSIASVFGSPGQANYAAANAFMEGFAAQRRSQGLPASIVHWGPWATDLSTDLPADIDSHGMADDEVRQRNLASRGLTGLRFQDAVDLLIDATTQQCPIGTVAVDADWNRMLAAGSVSDLPSVLRSLKGEDSVVVSGSAKDDAMLAELSKLDQAGRAARLQTYFAQPIGNIMSMDPDAIDPAQSLGSLGLDSLMAIELKNTIESQLDITIPISKFMDDPTLESLSTAVAEIVPPE